MTSAAYALAPFCYWVSELLESIIISESQPLYETQESIATLLSIVVVNTREDQVASLGFWLKELLSKNIVLG
ncbi:hypothetical protein AFLA_006359 [Aspergillus flavus NRRL3357]|nr:hypothetical protein AFLA_006359 [Aspergillus flavus NRRL3357]